MTVDPISKTAEAMRNAERQATARYWSVVGDLARGEKTPTAGQLAETCRAAGKSIPEFERDARLVRRRLDLAATAAAKPDLQEQLRKITSKLEKAGEKFAKAQEEFEDQQAALNFNAKTIRRQIDECGEAEKELAQTCPYPVKERHAELLRQIESVHKRRTEAEARIARLEKAAEYGQRVAAGQAPLSDEQRFDAMQGRSDQVDTTEAAMRRRAGETAAKRLDQANQLRAEMETIEGELANLAEHEAALRAEMAKP